MNELEGKVALISGATSYIGAAISRKMVDAGAKVVLGGRDEERGADIVASLGDSAVFVRSDVTSDADLDAMVDTAVGRFGAIDYVVAGAAVFDCGMLETTRDDWLRSFDINVVGNALLIQKAVPHMREQGKGAVVFIGSISGKNSQPNRIVYPTTKTALLGLNRNMAQALAPDNVRVNLITLGWTWSRNIERRRGTREAADAFAAEHQPLGRMIDPEEVGDAVVFLCSDRSSAITGTDLAVDGGYGSIGPEAMGQGFEKHPYQ